MTAYNNAKNSAQKATKPDNQFRGSSAFVRDVAMSIIGAETLKNRSVTGQKCNRLNTAPKPPLDPKLTGAVYGKKKLHLIIKFEFHSR